MQIYREITPLKEHNVFVVLDSVSNGFDYPIHNHPEYELNFVAGISGSRTVGDSTERYADFDLVLLGPYLYHKWDGDAALLASGQAYRVITIQFGMDLFNAHLMQKERFYKIRKLLQDSRRGIRFSAKTIQEAMPLMLSLTEDKGFANVIEFLSLLDLLSRSDDVAFLASEGFTPQAVRTDNNRIQIAYAYILRNFANANMKIGDLAALVNMSESAFSHFFQKYTNKSFTQFLIDVRVGHACKLLLDTDETINQICYQSGFNNLANFNRLFRKYRNCTPHEYRRKYQQNTAFDWSRQTTPWQFLPSRAGSMEKLVPAQYSTRLVYV
ncbi:MAG: helix-turn-helix domain-containing protein [Saprospiraceae bacterium]|nr:helix-turn-helix domain-containing protein [Saprospiraceae bacterium]